MATRTRDATRLGTRSPAALPAFVTGFGLGAFIDGIVLHQLVFHLALGAHHIRMVDNYQVYDWGFTALGVGLAALGWLLVRRAQVR